jgi:hypothetical protein
MEIMVGYNGQAYNPGHLVPMMRYTTGGGLVQHSTTENIADGAWHFIAVVLDQTANVFDCYIDGTKYSVAQPTDGELTCAVNTGIGREVAWDNGWADQDQVFLSCDIADVIMWQRALSATDIASISNPADAMLGDLLFEAYAISHSSSGGMLFNGSSTRRSVLPVITTHSSKGGIVLGGGLVAPQPCSRVPVASNGEEIGIEYTFYSSSDGSWSVQDDGSIVYDNTAIRIGYGGAA